MCQDKICYMNYTNTEEWYVLKDDSSILGPITKWEIVKKAKEKSILESTLIWLKGTKDWRQLRFCGEYRGYLNFIEQSATMEDINDADNNIPLTKHQIESKLFYYKDTFQEINGPIPLSEILFKLEQGVVGKNTLIKCDDGTNIWRTIDGLRQQFTKELHELRQNNTETTNNINNNDNNVTNDMDNVSVTESDNDDDLKDPTMAFLSSFDKDYRKKKKLGIEDEDLNVNNNENTSDKPAKKKKRKRKRKKIHEDTKKSIYITGLPNNITQGELFNFAEKCGVIGKDIFTSEYKIRIYKNENGIPKGDALVTYEEIPSVTLAIQMLDQTEIRDGYMVTIKKAQFDKNKLNEPNKKKRKINKQQLNILKKMNDQKNKLSWNDDDNDDDGLKIIILKNMFDLNDIEMNTNNDEFFIELKNEVKTEIENNIGIIHDIKIFNDNPNGIIKIKFYDPKSAQKCINIMNHRYFNEKIIECFYFDGITNYNDIKETNQIQDQRLQNWLQSINKK